MTFRTSASQFHRRLPLALVLSAAVLFCGASSARSATPQALEEALVRAKASLYAKMDPQKFWEESATPPNAKGGRSTGPGKHWGSSTAIAVYALLASGEKHTDSKLAPAVEWIKKQKLDNIYAIGLRAQIWPLLPPTPENLDLASRDRDYLYRGLHRTALPTKTAAPATPPKAKKGKKAAAAATQPAPKAIDTSRVGFYGNWVDDTGKQLQPGDPSWDLSVSRYGVLGMWACAQVDGVEVPSDYWVEVDKAWKRVQLTEGDEAGGWANPKPSGILTDQSNPKAAITAGGIITLYVTQDYMLDQSNFGQCRGGVPNPNVDAGLLWMDRHIRELLSGKQYQSIYSVERIGAASGRKYFGDLDWYSLGTSELLTDQKPNGSWGATTESTAFSMLFLASGRAPVVMNKLEYGLNDPAHKDVKLPWDQRPRDVANFARFAGRMSERTLNWQIVNFQAKPEDLHEAPILYVAGSRALDLKDDEIAKLRDYCLSGGLILFNADCAEDPFVQSVVGAKGVGRRMFGQYEWRELPTNHPIFTDQLFQAKNWKTRPRVLGLSNGVRELALIVPEADMGRAWQTRSEKTKREQFELGVNIYYYAAGKGAALYRGQSRMVMADPKVKPTIGVRIARLSVGDNPNPEPYAWRQLAAVLHNEAGISTVIQDVPLGQNKLVAGQTGFHLAHLTGTGRFLLTQSHRDEIKAYIASGGTLVVDAAGGDIAFADSAERELAAIFGGDPASVGPIVPPDDRVFSMPGFKIEQFEFRTYARGRITGKTNVPQIRAIDVAGRQRVFYSRYDLTGGVVSQYTDGIVGYAADTATDIMRNIVVFAAYNGRPPPAGAPQTAPPKPGTPVAPPGTSPTPPAKKGGKGKKKAA